MRYDYILHFYQHMNTFWYAVWYILFQKTHKKKLLVEDDTRLLCSIGRSTSSHQQSFWIIQLTGQFVFAVNVYLSGCSEHKIILKLPELKFFLFLMVDDGDEGVHFAVRSATITFVICFSLLSIRMISPYNPGYGHWWRNFFSWTGTLILKWSSCI